MKIAAIDPGGVTGLAIAKMGHTSAEIWLKKIWLASIEEPQIVLDSILTMRCLVVIMEDQPINGSLEGRRPFEIIHDGLIRQGYKKNKKQDYSASGLLQLINPGIWKPFVQAQHPDLSEWRPDTKHEEDAMSLLYYYVRTRLPKKQVYMVHL